MTPADPIRIGSAVAQFAKKHGVELSPAGPPDLTPAVETPEEAAKRIARRTEHRRIHWDAMRPPMYRSANITELTPDQNPDGAVTGWFQSKHRTLVMHGETGSGKTHAAYALGNTAVEAGQWVTAYTLADFNALSRPGADPEGTYDRAAGCDLFIIDDLGTEKRTEWTNELLHRILDYRVRELKRMIITTNLEGMEFQEQYGSRIFSRAIDDAVIVKFEGRSWRAKAPW